MLRKFCGICFGNATAKYNSYIFYMLGIGRSTVYKCAVTLPRTVSTWSSQLQFSPMTHNIAICFARNIDLSHTKIEQTQSLVTARHLYIILSTNRNGNVVVFQQKKSSVFLSPPLLSSPPWPCDVTEKTVHGNQTTKMAGLKCTTKK